MAGTESSLERMLRVLDAIEESDGHVTSDELLQGLGYTRSTLYRYLKILSAAGLITSLPDAGYTFGPRVAELDYLMRNRDPLIIASRPVMAELVRETPGIALLCRRYRDKVLCVHQERGNVGFTSTYERGRARPLTRGAASRIILAYLPTRVIERVYPDDAQAFRSGKLGETLPAVKASLKAMRQKGWDVTEGQIVRGVTGIAAPVFDARDNVLGSLSLTVGRARLPPSEINALAERVVFCARIVTKAIQRAQA
jgi:DNA-binding IclR family transcriptional regulator